MIEHFGKEACYVCASTEAKEKEIIVLVRCHEKFVCWSPLSSMAYIVRGRGIIPPIT